MIYSGYYFLLLNLNLLTPLEERRQLRRPSELHNYVLSFGSLGFLNGRFKTIIAIKHVSPAHSKEFPYHDVSS